MTKLERPIPSSDGVNQSRDEGFRASVGILLMRLHPDVTAHAIDALVHLRQSGLVPGIFFRTERLLSGYIYPLLTLSLTPNDILTHIREKATKDADVIVSTLLSHSNVVATTTTDPQLERRGCRVVGCVGDYVVVHWPGLPDAYDEYVLRTSITTDTHIDSIEAMAAPFNISSEFYNAQKKYAPMWINALDYMTPSTVKRPRSPSASEMPAHVKHTKVDSSVVARLDGGAAAAVSLLLQSSTTNKPTTSVLDHFEASATSEPTKGVAVHLHSAPGSVALEQQTVVAIPSCSRWFSLDAVHPLEKRMLPEFFDEPRPGTIRSKTPQVYVTYRNYMVHASRAQPHVYLTATACRRNLAGDVCAVLRVHEFLTHWGLINFHVPAHAMPPSVPSTLDLDVAALPTPALSVCESCVQSAIAYELSLDAKRKERQSQLGGPFRKLDAWGTRPGTGVCENCFAKRKFPTHLDVTDFVPVPSNCKWTDDHVQRLVDALDALDTSQAVDWNEVGIAVGKPPKECLFQFLQLPLDAQEPRTNASTSKTSGLFPLARATANVADIVASADPQLVQAATRAVLAELDELNTPSAAKASSPAAATPKAGLEKGAKALAKTANDAGLSLKEDVSLEGLVSEQVSSATTVALLAANAHSIATQEASAVKRLMRDLLQCQMEQVQLKMKAFQQLEMALHAEREELTKERHAIYMERLAAVASPDPEA
ncbi:hypothetical protein SPRG_02610 [Saprolegnia parasitica CBS 223.65]|uniref:SWIRM domain-containing protein n=1 Tax=Saprolegnia parasitica (strain CBS 223.65) TaxID=695850 RepID=A0A067CQX2_SAPPC|nr:hypothetical protein SPRG_02610 [Saprolegnia parasitica CBS 223.65]KDO32918.1 hypothetical protein SPRG_02610 [Saprolegnia parasitica CBS 223.65]|eukprot:XP_012196566.1 hypothetical protein SPRG_02610 [Saprolegnia parasitica CBS 223.65]